MVVIHGRYEYDDENLTPGRKKEGGLHQNLFDAEGNLKGNARFIPDDDQPPTVAPYAWASASVDRADAEEVSQLSEEEREQLRALVEEVVIPLLVVAIERGAPYAQRLWREKVRPAVRARVDAATRRLRRRRRVDREESTVLEGTVLEGTVLEAVHAETAGDSKVTMTASEAEARYLLAKALREASDEQLRVLTETTVVADDRAVVERGELKAGSDSALLMDRLSAEPAALTGEEVLSAIQLLFSADSAHAPPRPVGAASAALRAAAAPNV